MSSYKTYISEQRVYARMIDLEFQFDVADTITFLTDFKLDWRIGRIQEVDHSNAQYFYLELLMGRDENDQPNWVHIPHNCYVCVYPNLKDSEAPLGVSVVPAEDFEATFRLTTDLEVR